MPALGVQLSVLESGCGEQALACALDKSCIYPTTQLVQDMVANARVKAGQPKLDLDDRAVWDVRNVELTALNYRVPANLATFLARIKLSGKQLNADRYRGVLIRWDYNYDLLAVELSSNQQKTDRWIVLDMGIYAAELEKRRVQHACRIC